MKCQTLLNGARMTALSTTEVDVGIAPEEDIVVDWVVVSVFVVWQNWRSLYLVGNSIGHKVNNLNFCSWRPSSVWWQNA